jgi:aspartyl-tRNA(Asn)/glutamyl-tRNA(Gln) amidotransferase subunit C
MIDREQVRHVAHLGRLQLSESEEVAFTNQLGEILDYFEQLNELDPLLVGVEPTTRAIATVNVTRQDNLKPWEDKEVLLDGAPEREDDYFRVPQILG